MFYYRIFLKNQYFKMKIQTYMFAILKLFLAMTNHINNKWKNDCNLLLSIFPVTLSYEHIFTEYLQKKYYFIQYELRFDLLQFSFNTKPKYMSWYIDK